ncbi:MAG TPA: hypothetical protein VKE70_18440 [Candidatus Solibacter sp.]|nr:hypothetical protein [Candidatus Solibacter sp.]
MVGPTAQLVALACDFNGRVRGLATVPFLQSNSTAQFCEYIQFVRPHQGWIVRKSEWRVAAKTPDEWFAAESRSKRCAIIANYPGKQSDIPDHMLAGFVGGGGQWRLLLVKDGRMDVWASKWEVGNRDAPDRRIWRVSYGLIAENADFPPQSPESVEAIVPVFVNLLSDLQSFCVDHHLGHFATNFRNAGECLSADDPFALVYHKDLTPQGLLSRPASQLLAACQAAWVFGGMGSWNDMSFQGAEQSQYERLSYELYALINRAICAATNSSSA